MWDLPRPRIKPTSPALAGGLLTSEPTRKPRQHIYWMFYHKWLKFQCPTQTCWIHACTDGVWRSLCAYQAPLAVCPVVFWGNSKVQSLLYHEEMDPSFPFSCPQQGKGTTIWRRAAVHGLGSGNMDKQTRGQLGSAYRTEAPRATGRHHGSKTGHTNSVSVFTELGRKKKKKCQLRLSEQGVPAPTVSLDQQGHRLGVRTEQSLQSTNWWSEPFPAPSENYWICSNIKEIHQNYHLGWGGRELKPVSM